MAPSGIEPATFRYVAQCHRVPQRKNSSQSNLICTRTEETIIVTKSRQHRIKGVILAT
jgi:hypothetical protein